MGRQFGAIRKLPSGNFQASYVAPGIGRVTAPITFARYDQADTWLAAQRVDLARETWKAPSVGSISLRQYAVPWLSQRKLKPRTADLYQRLLEPAPAAGAGRQAPQRADPRRGPRLAL